MMETKFVDAPTDVLDQFEGKFRELAEEFKSYGGTVIVGMAMRDEMSETDGERFYPMEDHRFIIEPAGVAAYGMSYLLNTETMDAMYGPPEQERGDD